MNLRPYTKAIIAVIIGMLQVASAYFTANVDNTINAVEVQTIINTAIIALGGSAAVYALPNKK